LISKRKVETLRKSDFLIKKEILLVTMLFLLVASLITIRQVSAQEAKIYIDPETVKMRPGETFTVYINVANVTDLFGYELKLYYDRTVINITGAVRPSGHFLEPQIDPANQYVAKWEIKNNFNTTHGRLWLAYTLLAPETGRTGSGTLIQLNFTGLNIGETLLKFDEVILGNSLAEPILVTPIDGNVHVELPLLTLKVNPETVTATHRGEITYVNVDVVDLDVDWKAVGFEFKLGFDGTLLEPINITEGPFLKAFGETYMVQIIKQNYVHVGLLLLPQEDGNWTSFPEGSGTLATIFFNVTHGPSIAADLVLYDTLIGDCTAKPIPHLVTSGHYDFAVETLIHYITWTDPATNETYTFMVETKSNSTVNNIEFNQLHRYLTFTVTGPDDTIGFCNITIPQKLLCSEPDEWLIIVGGNSVAYEVVQNETHTSIYFAYSLSTKTVYIFGTTVIPEISMVSIQIIFLIMAAIAVILLKAKIFKERH
jgi:hypothetical protein